MKRIITLVALLLVAAATFAKGLSKEEKKILGKWKLESITDSNGKAVAIKDVYDAEPVYISFDKEERSTLFEGSDRTGGFWFYSDYDGAYDVTTSDIMGAHTQLWKPISMEKETMILELKKEGHVKLKHTWTRAKE